MNIKDIILDANLCNEADKEITFENKRIPYAIARKKHEFTKEKIHFYAEYYFLDLDDELISILSDYKNKYREFQIKLLAPHFYKHVNDLRWNLYVIFLVEDEKELMDIDVNAIENDDNYARKFFFNREETLKFLKREDIFFTNENNINRELKLGQFQQWVEILDTVKLTGCLAESKLRNENVELYLNTGSFEDKSFIDSSPKASQSDIRNKSHVDRVMSIEMGKFREHCFKKTGVFSFGQVNLLQGPNGCGKTSVTEAIELAITNSVKRLKDMGEEPGRYEGLKVILKSGTESKTYNPGLSSSVYKQIDSEWYGVPNVDRSQTTLNKNFNRFNYLDNDAANRFTKEQSMNPDEVYDYKDGLKKLFFDNETVNMEKRWMWYWDKFAEKQGKLKKELDSLMQSISDERQNLEKLLSNNSCNTNEINILASAVKYNNQVILQSGDHLQSIRALDETLKAVENTVTKLNHAAKTQNIYSYNDVLSKEIEINKAIEDLNSKIEEAGREKIIINTAFEDLNVNEKQLIARKNKLEKVLEQLKREIQLWQDIQHIIINYNRLEDLKQYKDTKDQIKKKISLLSDIKTKYPGIENIKKEDIFNETGENIEELEKKIEFLKGERAKVIEKMNNLHEKAGQIDSLRAKIKALGEEYLRLNGDDGVCPLCGYLYHEKSDLEESINNLSFQNNKAEEIKNLEKERNTIDAEISKKDALLSKEKSRLEKVRYISEAFKDILNSGYYEIEGKEDVIFIFTVVHGILAQEDSLNVDLQKSEAMIDIIQNEDYSDEKIIIAENYKKNNTRFIQYINEGKDVKNYLEYILINKDMFAREITEVKDGIADIEAKKIDLQSKIDHYKSIEQGKYLEIEDRKKMLHELSIIRNYFSVLRKHFTIYDGDDIFLWTENYDVLKTRCDLEVSYLETAQFIKESRERLKMLEARESLLAEQLKRCTAANKAFERMPKLDDAVSEFLENNKERIIFFFQMLHRPKEFESKLEYDEKGYFKLIRKGENDEVRCPQMSTGQRVSFAISVFLSLHLSAVNAPKFIMLDEPVTNLDDIHLLNLLDLLRDFAICGIQIFFTTANQDVAGLFRRKFSFFEDEFKHFKFERANNLPSIIKQITYNPMEDLGKEIQLAAN